jgi:hypothetical protein
MRTAAAMIRRVEPSAACGAVRATGGIRPRSYSDVSLCLARCVSKSLAPQRLPSCCSG